MATHSSVLAWRIPGTGSLVCCCLWGRTELDTTEATQQQQYSFLWSNNIPLSRYTVFCLSLHKLVGISIFPLFGYHE